MVKNPTPRQIAIFSALFVLALASFSLFLFYHLHGLFWIAIAYVVWGLVFFMVTYQVFIYFLRRYIYRKVKLIYKTIRTEKLSSEEKSRKVDMRRNIIEEAEMEVAAWAEQQRTELDKYKSWADYRRDFLGDISHELKTPIFNIQGYLDSLLDGGLEDPQVNRHFLARAAKNVERLQTIVLDLETISRLESGQLLIEQRVFDIRELAKEVFEDMEMKARDKNISLEFKDKTAPNIKVRADRDKIRQVLVNLVQNSIKYGISNGRTRIGLYDMEQMVLVEVSDNGIGIPRDHLAHVFDRFYRVDKSRSREQGGSGLGLSIVKHIIEAHQQTINVRSSPNKGATFGFTLEKA